MLRRTYLILAGVVIMLATPALAATANAAVTPGVVCMTYQVRTASPIYTAAGGGSVAGTARPGDLFVEVRTSGSWYQGSDDTIVVFGWINSTALTNGHPGCE
jgi:hypothetical protein